MRKKYIEEKTAKSVKFSRSEINFCLSIDLYTRVWVRVRVWSKVTAYDIPKISLNSAIMQFSILRTFDSIATSGSLFLREKVYALRTFFFDNNFISEKIIVSLFILKKLFSG